MIEIYTDGACSNNGADGAVGGYAWMSEDEEGIYGFGYGRDVSVTNNQMELVAIISAIKEILQTKDKYKFLTERIVIYTDSAYVCNCFQNKWYENWEKNGWKNAKKEPVKNKELWMVLLDLYDKYNIVFEKVKGHSDDEKNNIVDLLARTAAERPVQLVSYNSVISKDKQFINNQIKKYIGKTPKDSDKDKNKTNPKIITISGKAEAGKDTFALMLKKIAQYKGKKVCVLHYADLLKQIATNIYGWDGIKDYAGRRLLQRLGTDIVRKVDENFWADSVKRLIKVLYNEFDLFIIPDARFENEILKNDKNFEYSDKAIAINILRPNYINLLDKEQQNHQSETALDNKSSIFDYTIVNDSTINNLTKEAISLMDKLF